MGVQGVFTRSLDIALLENRIDIAVHSMKDVPTRLPEGISQASVLKRGNHLDLLVPGKSAWKESSAVPRIIATGSIRRKAQWLHRFPTDEVLPLRGNVNTRMQKLMESNWDAAIFAAAGLERIAIKPEQAVELDWMLPAPAQGAIMVAARSHHEPVLQACKLLNHPPTEICVKAERDFMRTLEGGCSMPISAYACIENDSMVFAGNMLSLDGKQKAEIKKSFPLNEADGLGEMAAQQLLKEGGREIAEQLRNG
jgi:hydroxymethylbilane synthase